VEVTTAVPLKRCGRSGKSQASSQSRRFLATVEHFEQQMEGGDCLEIKK
jgi:hypothetical protein